jgi:hypothetical protein
MILRIVRAFDRVWAEVSQREQYTRFYFAMASTLDSRYIGETDYLAQNVLNMPSLSNLTLGQVNIHRDTLQSIFCFTALGIRWFPSFWMDSLFSIKTRVAPLDLGIHHHREFRTLYSGPFLPFDSTYGKYQLIKLEHTLYAK